MKRVILITLFCFFILTNGVSQSYFNNRYDFYNENNASTNFIFVNDTFYLPVQFFTVGNSTIGKISKDGGLLLCNRYAASFASSYYFSNAMTQHENKIYTTGNGGYFNKISSPLYKHKFNGDTVKTTYYGDTAYYFLMQKIEVKTNEKNKILLIGVTDSICGPGHQGLNKPIIRVVDTNGILYQTKIYLSDCKYRNINSVTTTKDKGYLISMSGAYGTWDTETRILKLDSNLNLIWSKQINLTSSAEPEVYNDHDKFYYMSSTTVDSVWNFTYKWERACLIKMDTNGNVIWQKNYGVKQLTLGTTGLKKCINGDFIISGTRRTSFNELKGFIIRTDSIGNLKWWKDYRPKTTPLLDTVADNYLYDIMELYNGDLAAIGWAGASTISPFQQTWLLKVDSNGCFGMGGCNPNLVTGIKEILNENELILDIYPNPFINNITISYTLSNSNKANVEINLIEMSSGKLISRQTSSKNEDTIQFSTENLASGVYLVSIYNNGISLRNSKVINIK